MMEKSRHYSNKGGHRERSWINKQIANAAKRGIIVCKSDILFCGRRFARRIPDDGKR